MQVSGGNRESCGWTVLKNLDEALELACRRAFDDVVEGQGDVRCGQAVKLVGLQSRLELNGECGVALCYQPSAGRWVVRLKDGQGKQLKPSNLEVARSERTRLRRRMPSRATDAC